MRKFQGQFINISQQDYFFKVFIINYKNLVQNLFSVFSYKWPGVPGNIWNTYKSCWKLRSSRPEVFLRKGVLKICSKFTGEDPCQSVISIKLQDNFVEIALRHGCSPVNLLHIFRTPFPRNTSGWLFLKAERKKWEGNS